MKYEARFIRFVVCLIAVTLALSVIGIVGLTQEKVTLEMWSWRPEDADVYPAILAVFESTHPNIDVVFRPFKNTEYPTVLLTSLEAGEGPDIMQLKSYGGLQVYTKYLKALDNEIPALEGFAESDLAGARGRNDDMIYGVPFATQGLGIYYNTKIFEQYGLSEPSTWDEFLAICQELQDNGVIALANGGKDAWCLEVIFGVVGPAFYGATEFYNTLIKGDTTFEDPAFVRALEKTLELKPYMPPGFMGVGYQDQRALFYNEQAAMCLAGAWEVGGFKRENPDMEFSVFGSPPETEGEIVYISTFSDGSYGMNKDTSHPEEALEFLQFLASIEFGQPFTDLLAQLSSVPGVASSDAELNRFIELFVNPTPYIMLTGFRWEMPSGSEVLASGLQEMFQGSLSPKGVASQLQEAMEEWYEPFQDGS